MKIISNDDNTIVIQEQEDNKLVEYTIRNCSKTSGQSDSFWNNNNEDVWRLTSKKIDENNFGIYASYFAEDDYNISRITVTGDILYRVLEISNGFIIYDGTFGRMQDEENSFRLLGISYYYQENMKLIELDKYLDRDNNDSDKLIKKFIDDNERLLKTLNLTGTKHK